MTQCTNVFEYDYAGNFMELAEDIYSEYDMQIFCDCNCTSWLTLDTALDNRRTQFPDFFYFTEPRRFNCTSGPVRFGDICNMNKFQRYTFNDNLIDSIANIIDSTSNTYILNSSEKLFLKQINSNIYQGNDINICSLISSSDSINFSSDISEQLIKHTIGFFDAVVSGHIEIWGPDLSEEETINALVLHALSGLGGAWASAMKFVWENRRCIECADPNKLFYEMAWGFGGGALLAV